MKAENRIYKYIHKFKDDTGIYFILSNNIKKPNPLKAKFAPFDDVPTKYLKLVKREQLDTMELYFMDKWVSVHGRKNKNLFYCPMYENNIIDISLQKDPRIIVALKDWADSICCL